MDQQLSKALDLHKKGEKTLALQAYEKVLETNNPPIAAFLNASSILRSQDKHKKSIKILSKGLRLYPKEPGLWNNIGNCYMDISENTRAIVAFRRALKFDGSFSDAAISLSNCLRDQGHSHLSYAIIREQYIRATNLAKKEKLLVPLLEAVLSNIENNNDNIEKLEPLVNQIEKAVRKETDPNDPCKAAVMLTQIWIEVGQLDRALKSHRSIVDDARKFFAMPDKKNMKYKKSFFKTWNCLSWNLGIKLLKKGQFKEGWQLYEHGLRVPAAGPQRWQRALKKPFSLKEVAPWRGEPIKNKRILLLGEQGIGDTMMFASLIPKLINEGGKIFLAPGDRLEKIYERSLPEIKILSKNDFENKVFTANDFDFQSPIGSVCQYRFTSLEDYGAGNPILKSNQDETIKFRKRYFDGRPLIGISWQGGGKASRVAMKSIHLKQLTPLLSCDDFRFVSLQYGDDAPHIQRYHKYSGINIVHDDEVDPLKDMNGWLNQVAAMDAVISIANTTVHGAGGLGIPTMCLVSKKSDWRWIDPEIYRGCYWYPSVTACYQSPKGNWEPALSDTFEWMKTIMVRS